MLTEVKNFHRVALVVILGVSGLIHLVKVAMDQLAHQVEVLDHFRLLLEEGLCLRLYEKGLCKVLSHSIRIGLLFVWIEAYLAKRVSGRLYYFELILLLPMVRDFTSAYLEGSKLGE